MGVIQWGHPTVTYFIATAWLALKQKVVNAWRQFCSGNGDAVIWFVYGTELKSVGTSSFLF